MKLWTRLAMGTLLAIATGFGALVYNLWGYLEPIYRSATEEPLVDAARILAAVAAAEQGQPPGLLETALQRACMDRFAVDIHRFAKTRVDVIVYVTDARGRVVHHSGNRSDVGADYSSRSEVARTLAGQYGTRTASDLPGEPAARVLYVGAPIRKEGKLAGVLVVGKPTRAVDALLAVTRRKLAVASLAAGLAVIAACFWFARRAVQPVHALTGHARAVRDGRPARLPELDGSEIRELGAAFEEMRDALEGRRYVENYVQTLTHSLKSPLASIRGAAELLGEEMPAEARREFLGNILGEVERLTSMVERLLLLSSVETRKGRLSKAPVDLGEIARETISSLQATAAARDVVLAVLPEGDGRTSGERVLLCHAVLNLLGNALDFSPRPGRVDVRIRGDEHRVQIVVDDSGPGVPDFALDRVFERFFSMERPDTGKKSSGLGLSLVREVALLHGGDASLENRPGGGARATLWLPRSG